MRKLLQIGKLELVMWSEWDLWIIGANIVIGGPINYVDVNIHLGPTTLALRYAKENNCN